MKPVKRTPALRLMKKGTALLLCCLLALTAFSAVAEEEESVERNRTILALEEAQKAASPAQKQLETFLELSEEERSQAQDRGKQLAAQINASQRTTTFTLEGDTDLSDGYLPLTGSNTKIFTIDLNGHVLYAPIFAYGIFVLQNGVAADVSAENDNGILKMTVEADCCVLKHSQTAALSLDVKGDLYLVNRGLVGGVRRMLYQNTGAAKISIVNDGTIWSDTYGISIRCFHQNAGVTLENRGTVTGLIRAMDIHCSGGSLSVTGGGSWTGAAGPDVEIPRASIGGTIITDDLNLDEETLRAIQDKLDPYGDKDIPTGISFDLQSSAVSYWRNWRITATLWASRGVLRMALPQNEKIKGHFLPKIMEASPSRTVLMTTELAEARTHLTGGAAEESLKTILKSFDLEGFLAGGGEMAITAWCRTADENGKLQVYFSNCDTRWSRLTGLRKGNETAWEEAENGQYENRAPTNAWNDYYQLRSALDMAKNGGAVLLDRDAMIPEGEGRIPLAPGAEIRADGTKLSGDVRFTVEKTAVFSGLGMAGETLQAAGLYRYGDQLELEDCAVGTLKADHLGIRMENSTAENLHLTLTGGQEQTWDVTVLRQLAVSATERLSGKFLFSGELGTEILLNLMRGSTAKTFTFRGETGAKTIDVIVWSDRDPSQAWQPTESEPMAFYASYLRMIHPEELKGPDGLRPTVTFRDEAWNELFTCALQDDGSWIQQ